MKMQFFVVLVLLAVFASRTYAQTDKECALLSSPNTGATSTPALTLTPGSLDPNEEVKALQVQIDTSGGLFTGTTDDVWLDLGPRAWKIGDDFGSGSSKTIAVNVNWVGNPLQVRDLVWVRLEKKGICGLTNAPDSLLDLAFLGGATPANLLPSAREKVEELERDVEIARNAIAAHEKLIKAENDLISSATAEINRFEALKADVGSQLLSTSTQIDNKALELQKGVIKQFENVEEHYTETVCSTWGKLFLGPVVCLFHSVVDRTRIVQRVTQAYGDATNALQRLRTQAADLQSKALNLQSQIQQQTNNRAAHLAHLANLQTDLTATKTLDTVDRGLEAAKTYANALDDLAKKALAGLDIPKPGQWEPSHIVVAVNGKKLAEFDVHKRLKQFDSSWAANLYARRFAPEEEFVYGLRKNVNPAGAFRDSLIAGITTSVFKDNSISGWQSRPLDKATVYGVLEHAPSPGTDDFVSLDLKVLRVDTRSRTFVFDDEKGVRAPRFIRIEYHFGVDGRFHDWKEGQIFRVQGPVRWDTDQYGFYELHPVLAGQIDTVQAVSKSTAPDDVVTAIGRVIGWIQRRF